jgi:hypothetical protein
MSEIPPSPEPSPEFVALGMLVAAYLGTLTPARRDVFAMSLLRVIKETEAAKLPDPPSEQLEHSTTQAVTWLREMFEQMVGGQNAA